MRKTTIKRYNLTTKNYKNKHQKSIKTIENWWDYLLECTKDTKSDRYTIYWKYKHIFDSLINNTEKSELLNKKFSDLPTKMREILKKIYKNEFKK